MLEQSADTTATVDDTQYDGQIIAALIETELGLLNALYRDGVSKQLVSARAAKLGLTHEFIKRCRLTGTRPSLRKCIKCDASFLSAGPHNRLCRRCPPR